MIPSRSAVFLLCLASVAASPLRAGDWPGWRGPTRNGVAEADQDPPLRFGATEHRLWSVPLPGRAHGSATVVGDRVYVQTADEATQVQSVLCLDRLTGEKRWQTDLHRGGLTQKINQKASWASSTPACDGERVYVNFLSGDAVSTTALDVETGRTRWQTRLSGYVVHQGYGSSPVIHGKLVIASADNKGGGAVCGLDRQTGAVAWKIDRPRLPNYASPVVLRAAGRDQLFLTGAERVSAFDPVTGARLWEIEGATTECVTTTPTDGERIFSSGGYPKNHVAAIAADGSGRIVWETKDRVYVPSMLVREGHLYAVMDSGVAICWDSATGEERWKARLGGNFTASPVLVGDRIYAANESGTLFVYRADPAGLTVLAENRLGEEIYASPAICGGRIYLRVADYDGETRRESLHCYGVAP